MLLLNNSMNALYFSLSQPHFHSCQKYGATLTKVFCNIHKTHFYSLNTLLIDDRGKSFQEATQFIQVCY